MLITTPWMPEVSIPLALHLKKKTTKAVTLLVEAGEPADEVYAEQPPTLSFKKARSKIFANDMTIEKLSRLMGRNDKYRIVNWAYITRTKGNAIHPSPTASSPSTNLSSEEPKANTNVDERRSAHPRIPPTRRHTLPRRRRALDRFRRRSGSPGGTPQSALRRCG